MKYKKIMLLAIFLVSLLAVSAVSAADNATSDVVSVEEDQAIEQIDNDELISTTDDGTFTALQNKINNAASGSTITLENDYDYDDGFDIEGININKSLTIDGNGYMLNGNNKARIFNIAAQNVILKNIDFSNSLYSYDNGRTPTRAGAIYWAGDNGMMLNCMFTNSSVQSSSWRTANNWGGAVYWDGAEGILSGCTFNNCHATIKGDQGECRGGAICWAGVDGNLSYCNFINCFAKSSSLGECYGGAIHWSGSSGVLSDCNFRKCQAYGSFGDGGAICWIGDYGTLKDSNFTDNSASYAGGAIDLSYADYCNIYGCNFVKCSSDFGGAIAVRSTSNHDHVYNSTFESCSADIGGAVVWYSVGNLKYCNFTGCHAVDGGGSVYWDGNYGEVYDCCFENSTCNAEGGAVYWRNDDGGLYNCNFIKSKANDGGAVYWYGKNGELYDCSFLDSSSNNNGGAIYWFNSGGKLSRTSFVNSVSKGNGGAVYWYGDDGEIIQCEYAKNSPKKNDIYIFGKNVEIIDNLVKISAEDVIKYYGGSERVIVALTDDGNALSNVNVKISANGETSTVNTDSDGKASILLNLPVGTYDVVSTYNGVSATSKVTVKSTLTTSDASGTYLNSKVSATFLDAAGKALASKQVTFKVADKTYTATTNSNGAASANIPLDVGTYTVTAVNPASKEEKQFKLTISKASSTTSLTAVQNGKSVTLTAALTPNAATGKVTFEINGKTKQSSISNGKASATFTDLSPNTYPATATYGGDANYKTSSKTASVKVDKVYSIVDVGDVEGFYLDSKVSATFLDANGKALANTKVTFKAGGKSYPATTNSKGAATANIDLDVGTYNVTAVNPDTKEEKQFMLTITKPDAKIVPLNLNAEYASGTFTFKLVDSNTNKPLAGKKLYYTIITGGINTGGSLTTDANGIATLDNTNLKVYKWENGIFSTDGHIEVGKQLFSIKVDDSSISASEIKDNFTVRQAEINININPYSEYYGSNKKVVIDVTNAKTGDPMKGIDIHLYMANTTAKDYYFQTGDDGTAQINVSGLVSGEYSLTVSNNDTKNIKEKKVSGVITVFGIPTKITVTAPNTCYCNSENTVTVKITDKSTGEAVANAIVLVQPNAGKTSQGYIYQTNGDGLITFSYGQAAAGSYKLVFTMADTRYSASSVTKTITVKHLVTLKTVTVKKSAKKLVLQATLGKVKGKYLKSKTITFKFNGKKYKANTDKKGVAKVTIKSSVLKKLKVGKKVTYQATYLKDTVKKTVKVKK